MRGGVGHCPALPPQAAGRPPCIPEFGHYALVLGVVLVLCVVLVRRMKGRNL